MKRRAKIGLVVGVIAAVALAGGVAWVIAQRQGPSAAEVAESYFRALEQGETGRALTFTNADAETRASAEAAASGIQTAVSDTAVKVIEGTDEYVVVEVTYMIGSQDARSELALRRGGEAGWLIDNAFGELSATSTLGDAVAVGDLVFPTSDDETISLPPGLYTVSGAPRDLVEGEAAVPVIIGVPAHAEVEASLSAEGTALIESQLDDYARACAQPATTVPANCGLRVPWAADLATLAAINFRIDQLPVLTMADDLSSFAATDGIIVATATGTTRDGASASFTYRADDWTLRGVIEFTDGRMALRVT